MGDRYSMNQEPETDDLDPDDDHYTTDEIRDTVLEDHSLNSI